MINIYSVQVGRFAPLGPNLVSSGYVNCSVSHQIEVTTLGLAGDEQADLTVHGGPEKAVYGYAMRHYLTWRVEHPEHARGLIPGGFRENLTFDGLAEDEVFVGDVHRIAGALLQVCQPRQPCFKLALHFGDKRLPKAMVRSGRAGWYYRVLEPGLLGAGDEVEQVAWPQPGFPLSRLIGDHQSWRGDTRRDPRDRGDARSRFGAPPPSDRLAARAQVKLCERSIAE